MAGDEITPERARALLDALGAGGMGHMGVRNTPAAAPRRGDLWVVTFHSPSLTRERACARMDLAAASPDLARAYLAAIERAEAAERERDALAVEHAGCGDAFGHLRVVVAERDALRATVQEGDAIEHAAFLRGRACGSWLGALALAHREGRTDDEICVALQRRHEADRTAAESHHEAAALLLRERDAMRAVVEAVLAARRAGLIARACDRGCGAHEIDERHIGCAGCDATPRSERGQIADRLNAALAALDGGDR